MRQTNSFDLAGKGYYHLILSNIHDSRVYKYNETYLCVFVLEGKQTVEINKKIYNLVEFDYLIIRPQDELRLVENEEKRQLFLLYISYEEMDKHFIMYGKRVKNYIERCPNDMLIISGDYNVKFKIDEIYNRILKYGDRDKILSKLFASEILSGVVRRMHRWHNNDEIPKIFIEAMLAMHELKNLSGGAQMLEKLTNYSRAHLCRLVKKYYKMTPHDYIKSLRLNIAYNLIKHTDKDYIDIVEEVGYQSISQFYTTFKAYFGITPAVLRKNRNPKS